MSVPCPRRVILQIGSHAVAMDPRQRKREGETGSDVEDEADTEGVHQVPRIRRSRRKLRTQDHQARLARVAVDLFAKVHFGLRGPRVLV